MTARTYGFQDPGYQAQMLLDRVRVAAYSRAVREVVRPGDVVLDLGAGTGVLAFLAVRAGARKAYAVEQGEISLLARELARENGMADRVEVLRTDAREAQFEEPPTVIVTETLGMAGLDEEILGLVATVRPRCARDVRIIPGSFTIVWTPLWDGAFASEMDSIERVESISMRGLRNLLANRVMAIGIRSEEVVGEPASSGPFVVGVDATPDLFKLGIRVLRDGPVNAVGAWFEAALTETVFLSTGPDAPRTHWPNLKFPLDPPLECRAGDLLEVEVLPRLVANRSLWAWTVHSPRGSRQGDAFAGGLPDPDNPFAGTTVSLRQKGRLRPSPRLAAWALMLDGRVPDSAEAMAERLLAAAPERYADLEDARQEALLLLRSAGALT